MEKKIVIPFNSWSEERLRAGKKTATTRNSKYGEPGDVFEVIGRKYELVDVKKVRLSEVGKHFYDVEGAKDEKEFIEVWKGIHPLRGWVPDDLVFIHFFSEVK